MAKKRKITDVVINVNTKGASAAEKQLEALSKHLDDIHKKSNINVGSKSAAAAGGVDMAGMENVSQLTKEFAELGKIAKEPITLQVKQKGILAQVNNLKKLQAEILEVSDYAELIDEAFESIRDINPFGNLDHTLQEIEASLSRMNGVLDQVNSTLDQGFTDSFNQAAAGMDNAVDSAEDIVRATNEGTEAFEKQTKTADRLNKKVEELENKNKKLNNRLKDNNRQGTNQVRNFSAMAQSAGGLASVYALVAANVFAATEGFRLLNEAASLNRLEEVSNVMSNQIGVSIKGVAKDLQEATDYAISWEVAIRQAAAATAFGFDQETISKFATVAKRASIVLGVDMVDALNRVTRGVSKQEIELLDELGITVRLNEAFSEYAAQHNIAADSLNSFQRQQALSNAVIARSEQNLGAVDDALRSTEWEKFGANVAHAAQQALQAVAAFEPLLWTLEKFNDLMSDAPSSQNVIDEMADAFAKGDLIPKFVALNKLIEERNRLVAKSQALTMMGDADSNEFRNVENNLSKVNVAIRYVTESGGLLEDQAMRIAAEIGNLGLLSRTLSTDLTSLANDLSGESNPLVAMGRSAEEAMGSVNKLLEEGLELDEVLAKLKISQSQWLNLGDVKAYTDLMIQQKKAQDDLATTANHRNTSDENSLSIAAQQLEMMFARHNAEMRVLDTTTKTSKMKLEEFELTEKIRKTQEKIALDMLQQGRLTREFEHRKKTELEQMTLILEAERQQLEIMRQNSTLSGDTVRDQERLVLAKERELQIAKETAAENMRAQNQSFTVGNIGELDAGLGDTANGIVAISEAWDIVSSSASSAQMTMQASLSMAAGFTQSLGGMISAASGAVTSSIDAEIAAVEASGMSQEEQEAKIKALNKKKIKEQEKFAKASILLNTAMGVAMALGSAPPPLNFVFAGLTAAAGALAFAQASNTASSQLAGLASSSSSASDSMTLTVGQEGRMSTDVSGAASASERAQTLGDRGIYGRASGGNAPSAFIAGEGGRELVIPKADSIVKTASETEQILGGGSKQQIMQLNISAIDAKSLEDRAPEILDSIVEEARQRGIELGGA
ncbi:pore-forming tail tip protein pb2 [Vibrio phage VCPH]|nr:pore-forming tail tip protein pb2 [Vibrio phage VCPH]